MQKILLTGSGGSIGQMLAAQADKCTIPQQSLSLRNAGPAASIDADCTLLLHLANITHDVEKNVQLQQRLAEAIAGTNIQQVIVPMSFSTLGEPSDHAPDPGAFNFGFRVTMNDPYPAGKLKAEEFWLTWQRKNPERKLLLVYVPTILGPHSKWTNEIARFASQQTVLVPRIDRFFTIREAALVAEFHHCFEQGLDQHVERRLLFSDSGSLRDAISVDRVGVAEEFEMTAKAKQLCAIAEQNQLVNKGLAAQAKLVRTVRQHTSRSNRLPISPKYMQLFLRQASFADRLLQAGMAQRNASV